MVLGLTNIIKISLVSAVLPTVAATLLEKVLGGGSRVKEESVNKL
tara:strand:- start:698 stop:832 length:135 start_codon:yes stop_codon:yes gene_type:complete